MKNTNKKAEDAPASGRIDKEQLPGYPIYPANEDIYSKFKEESEIDPEDLTHKKRAIEETEPEQLNEKDFTTDFTGSDLDVPGADLDDEAEEIGSEDEENNYYSLGGDNHTDLEEDKGS